MNSSSSEEVWAARKGEYQIIHNVMRQGEIIDTSLLLIFIMVLYLPFEICEQNYQIPNSCIK